MVRPAIALCWIPVWSGLALALFRHHGLDVAAGRGVLGALRITA